ncbi:MAG: AIR synthase-related protein, partial [Candidatus Rokuibacteriota bacterium]
GLVTAAHDCAEGGVAVALAESCITGRDPVGCDVGLAAGGRPDLTLFGEGPSRVVVAVESTRVLAFEGLMAESAIPWRWIGVTGGSRLTIRAGARVLVDADLGRLDGAWRRGFERHLA